MRAQSTTTAPAHAVLEEAPASGGSSASSAWQLLTLSARTDAALDTATDSLAQLIKRNPDLCLADVAYTLHAGRRSLARRRAVVCQDSEDAVSALESLDEERVFTAGRRSGQGAVIFMFPGQGAQHINMAQELYRAEPAFREHVDACCGLLQPHLGIDLRTLLYPAGEDAAWAAQQLNETCITQPALFVVEYALAQLWMSWGVRPSAMIGHSIGEYAAACVAGVLSVEDALATVAARGRLLQQLQHGAMLAVSLPEQQVQAFLGTNVSLAAINGPSQCVVSGTSDSVDEIEKTLVERDIACRRLRTSHAFHSPMVDPIIEVFAERMERVHLHPPRIPYISNVTGTWITPAQCVSPAYWTQQLRQPVRFASGLEQLLTAANGILLEVGPGAALTNLARQQISRFQGAIALASLYRAQPQPSDMFTMLTTLGKLWALGVPIDWRGFYRGQQRRRVPLSSTVTFS